MNRIKLLVFLAFALFAIAFYGNNFFTPKAAGAVGGNSLDAPTSVTASDKNYANKIGIMWDTIRGATSYRVFRNTTDNSATATEVGTSVANYFFDTTASTNQIYFYFVKAENTSATSDFSSSDQGERGVGNVGPGPFPPLNPPPAPPQNPVTATKSFLGKTLFWDEQMSSTRTVACGTCHGFASGGSDGRSFTEALRSTNPGFDGIFGNNDDVRGSAGVIANNLDGTYNLSASFGFNEQTTDRKANTFINAAYSPALFWDGRALPTFRDPITNQVIIPMGGALESQVMAPPVSGIEMAHGGRDWNQVATRISGSKPLALSPSMPQSLETWIGGRTYPQLFEEAFGTPEVTPVRIAMAIASYERSLFSDQTPLDKASAQIEPLTPAEEQGRQLFVQLQCNVCHDGSLLADDVYHNIGVRPQAEDIGREAVTSDPMNRGQFRTPTLRNVELRAPYMHNGRFQTLEEVIEFYNRGGDFDAPNIDHGNIRPLNLNSQEKASLVTFLKRPLTDPRVANGLPPFNSPTLYTQSNRVPQNVGTGRAGSGGLIPKAVAIEPPIAGNPSFTVGVSEALGNAQAVLVIDSSDPGIGSTIPATGSFARVSTTLSGVGSGNGFGSVSLAIPDTAAIVGQTFFGRWYITDASAANGFSVTQAFQFTVFGEAAAANNTRFDFDGDRKTDIGIFRPNLGQWWYLRSFDNVAKAFEFGQSSDKIVPADFTGDGKTDIAFFRPSTGQWFVLRSEDNSFFAFDFGTNGDIPAPADFDGDGKADPAIFRPSNATWFILNSGGGTTIQQFGLNGDAPIVEDYDGDGKADLALFRPSESQWFYQRSTDLVVKGFQFGSSGDKAVPADFTGDGKADIAFWRPSSGEWFILRSEDNSFFAFPFGTNGDIPTPGDYDGDGTADAAVFRTSNNTWFLQRSTAGFTAVQFGIANDVPIPSAYTP
jgi:cytochrome c peroxidase